MAADDALVIAPECLGTGPLGDVPLRSWEEVRAEERHDFDSFRTILVAPWYPLPGRRYRRFPPDVAHALERFLHGGGSLIVLVPGRRCRIDPDRMDPVDFSEGQKPRERPDLVEAAVRVLRAKARIVPIETCRIALSFQEIPPPADPPPALDLTLASAADVGADALRAWLERHPAEVTRWSMEPSAAKPTLEPLAQHGPGGEVIAWVARIGQGRLFLLPLNAETLCDEDVRLAVELAHPPRPAPVPAEPPPARPPAAALEEPAEPEEPTEEIALEAAAAGGPSIWGRILTWWRRRGR